MIHRQIFDYVAKTAFRVISQATPKAGQGELTKLLMDEVREDNDFLIVRMSDEALLKDMNVTLDALQRRYEPTLPLLMAKMGASMERLARLVFISLQEKQAPEKAPLRRLLLQGWSSSARARTACSNGTATTCTTCAQNGAHAFYTSGSELCRNAIRQWAHMPIQIQRTCWRRCGRS